MENKFFSEPLKFIDEIFKNETKNNKVLNSQFVLKFHKIIKSKLSEQNLENVHFFFKKSNI